MNDHYETKQVIVLRTDLRDTKGNKIPRGKQIAQCAHASLKVFLDRMTLINIDMTSQHNIIKQTWESCFTDSMLYWLNGAFAKIILGCNSLEELMKLVDEAKKIDLPYAVIEDNGTTCFGGVKTITCAAFGPANSNILNQITGNLKLLV
jgi:peptidyl-tRNA hydrolase